jgi:hypothetical protein
VKAHGIPAGRFLSYVNGQTEVLARQQTLGGHTRLKTWNWTTWPKSILNRNLSEEVLERGNQIAGPKKDALVGSPTEAEIIEGIKAHLSAAVSTSN